ncbi:SGNH/GDSL hydrolase family protein [Rhodococcoides corynebacterioides]|uniref:SGNH/GDSL hydrolase family protein n=1 Tax=Rhodococcoides corynebacterioides TaxID=53972 RepID=A0ABS7P1H5_9NOCA|nr:SGNH/GDSL hydrolase family protein [Rhodococcus corynebacterioides]MBY6366227.1 SGNH/GDSL hydrolase family protein [Rhodococcus corynebacterioides]MBY6406862.1 SGNH/GDSL hydrolase family protein [Rhodococcus corynebacterioides]
MSTRGAVAVLAGLALVGAGCAAGTTPSEHRIAADATTPVVAHAATAPRAAPERVAVIGDSFSAGSANDVVWPDVLADEHGFELVNVSLGGAGYVAGADALGTFGDQVDDAIAADPDVILVVGSENDVDADPTEVVDAATEVFTRLHVGAPGAIVVAVGPIWSGDVVVPAELRDVDAAVEAAALAADVDYVDTLDAAWLADPAIIQDDGDHPTDAGQLLLAEAIDDAVSTVEPGLLG